MYNQFTNKPAVNSDGILRNVFNHIATKMIGVFSVVATVFNSIFCAILVFSYGIVSKGMEKARIEAINSLYEFDVFHREEQVNSFFSKSITMSFDFWQILYSFIILVSAFSLVVSFLNAKAFLKFKSASVNGGNLVEPAKTFKTAATLNLTQIFVSVAIMFCIFCYIIWNLYNIALQIPGEVNNGMPLELMFTIMPVFFALYSLIPIFYARAQWKFSQSVYNSLTTNSLEVKGAKAWGIYNAIFAGAIGFSFFGVFSSSDVDNFFVPLLVYGYIFVNCLFPAILSFRYRNIVLAASAPQQATVGNYQPVTPVNYASVEQPLTNTHNFCSECGAKLDEGAQFCKSCGTKVS